MTEQLVNNQRQNSKNDRDTVTWGTPTCDTELQWGTSALRDQEQIPLSLGTETKQNQTNKTTHGLKEQPAYKRDNSRTLPSRAAGKLSRSEGVENYTLMLPPHPKNLDQSSIWTL